MANTTIPNLPATTSLTGPEELNVVQSNTSKYTTVAQIGAYVNANYPAQGITSITAASPLSGGTITTTGTIGLTSNGVTNAYLATMSPYTIKANITSGTVAPTDATLTAILDTLGSTQGMTLYRGNTSWSTLPSSGTNTLLSVSGPNANPAWQTLSYMIDNAINSASAQGTILYRGASSWSALAPGLSGQLLRTGGASADPSWYTVTGAGTVTSVNASGGTTGMTFTGGPITVSGTLTMSGTLAVANGGTGQTTASAAFNALSPITTTGDLIIGNGTNSATRLAIGSNGYVLTSNGTTASWAASAGGVTSFQTSLSGLTPSTSTAGAVTLAGTLGATSGGTGFTTYAAGDLIYASATNTLSKLTAGTNGYVLTLASGVPTWAASTGGVTSFSAGSTGLTPSTATTGAITLAGTLAVANGGTGTSTPSIVAGTNVTVSGTWPNQTINATGGSGSGTVNSGTAGQLTYYASTGTPVSGNANATISGGAFTLGVAGTAAGSLLLSGGTSGTVTIKTAAAAGTWSMTLPTTAGTNGYVLSTDGAGVTSWIAASGGGGTVTSVNVSGGTTGLTTSGGPVTGSGTITMAGTLASANGGTGFTTYAAGDLIYASATNTLSKLTAGTNGYVLTLASGVPTWAASTGGVTSFSAGSTGLTPSTATTGAITLAGTLAVANGGTGVTTSSGANSVVLRDANSNITANYLYTGYSNTAAAGTTTTLTAASAFNYVVTGSGGQTFKLPDATTLSAGATYIFNNNQTSGTIVVQNNSATTVVTVQSGAVVYLTLLTNSVAAGT